MKRSQCSNSESSQMLKYQYYDCDTAGTHFNQNSVDKLTEASQTFNQQDLAFTVQLGDIGDIIDRYISNFPTILPIYNKIESPKYHVLGNHFAHVPNPPFTIQEFL
ncbi:hypothetical protein ABES25_07520 [Bacillus gobiensis]|uniref:hypothetical protein n=1 Tax=Bacillus gobiensis TaxID=1441095 RepID=UPI003D1C0D08